MIRFETPVNGVLMPDCLQDYVAALLTCASWVLRQLSGRVVEHQRADVIETLGEARDLVEVHCKPAMILVRDGSRLLVRLPAA